ncbi:MAG: heavy metal translocating P-type ATPase [Enhygromyxa sp.]
MSCGCEVAAGTKDVDAGQTPVWRIVLAVALAGQSMLISLTLNLADMRPNERAFFYVFLVGLVVATFELVGRPLWAAVRRALAERSVRFELLFATAIAGALGISLVAVVRGAGDVYFDLAIILLALHAVGHRVNGVERGRTLAAVDALRFEDRECLVRSCCGSTRRVPVAEVEPGWVVVVHPGERVAIDGIVEASEAFVREAWITGEPLEVSKRPGDLVHAGSVVVDATLHLRVTGSRGQRMLDRVASAIEDAWSRPARLERAADRVTRWLLPAVILLAAVTFVGWSLARGVEAGTVHAMAVLLVACPCAMGFAIPLTIAGTLGALGRRGFFLRGGEALERLAKVDTVVLDKTGTLTCGDARLVDWVLVEGEADDEAWLLELLASVERASHHPLARAFDGLGPKTGRFTIERLRVLPGKGIEAECLDIRRRARVRVALGITSIVSPEDSSLRARLEHQLRASPAAHRIAVVLDGRLVGLVAVREQPRPGALGLAEALEHAGLRVIVLTGDHDPERSACFAAAEMEVEHGMVPTDKSARVKALAAAGHKVLFVGDGINDGAAMAASYAALAPDDGTQLAQDLAHGVVRGASIQHLADAIEVARRSVASLRGSLAYALVYNVVGMSVAAAGLLHPVFAALLMVCSSLFVSFRASALVSQLAARTAG